MRSLFIVSLVFFSLVTAPVALAWGERGHDLIARAAARVAAERAGKNAALAETLITKEHMFGHLANVPDIVWRAMGKEVEDVNGPTHYLDAEYVTTDVSFAGLPKTVAEAEANMAALCAKPTKGYACPVAGKGKPTVTQSGSAPWRVQQVFTLMTDAFARARKLPDGSDRTKALDEAWLYAGLMSHFVGDLAQPYHTTTDYDGWESGHGGVHRYFETAIVSTLPLSLDADVLKAARAKPSGRLDKLLPADRRQVLKDDPLSLMLALVVDSYDELKTANGLDSKFALTEKSRRDKGMKIAAKRRDTASVMARYQPLITSRLALAADTLARLWLLAYERGGSPDLSSYRSYAYATAPAFIQPDYLATDSPMATPTP